MADQKIVRNALMITGAAAACYFLWKYTPRGNTAGPAADATATNPNLTTPMEITMTHILHVNASPRGEGSQSRLISNELVEALKAAHPDMTVTDRDLGHQVIPFVTEPFIYAMYTPQEARTPEQKELLTLSDELIAELKAADVYVFGVPMYNFGVPAVFKAYIDYVARANETFNPATYEGLLKNKKAYVVSAHGGAGYGPGQERESYNQLVPTLRGVLGFLGVTAVEFISVEGTSAPEEKRAPMMDAAREKIKQIAKAS
jgi:FMN-dependent NADH-azoreductase